MQKYVLVLTSTAALLAGSALAASAQQSDIPSMGEQLAQLSTRQRAKMSRAA
jgi:hypothetical protein